MSEDTSTRPSTEPTAQPESNATSHTLLDEKLSRSWQQPADTVNGSLSPDTVTEEKSTRPSHQYFDRRSSAQRWLSRRKSLDGKSDRRRSSVMLQRTPTGAKRLWKFTLREWDDDDEEDWWFASTAIPLLAATIGPLANVLSIAALVSYWRMCKVPGADATDAAQCVPNGQTLLGDLEGQTYRDPKWCIDLNAVSLVAGFVGNFFLLCNFTHRIRYIIALPVTIVMWYIATGILIALTVSMELYISPTRPQQTYTQGFWYAVIAACLYMICAMLLMVNMLGYFMGHYPQHFTLTDSQRTLILQTMLFFIWLAGGGGVFSRVETLYGTADQDWSYVNALYFCDVTILTVGFGDLYPTSNTGRGLVFPYSVGGIIMLGLMVSSITKFAGELGSENVVRRHVEHSRVRTIGRTVTTSMELERRQTLEEGGRPIISAPFPMAPTRETTIQIADDAKGAKGHKRTGTIQRIKSRTVERRKPKILILREEKDRFEAMRHIQHDTSKFKRWSALVMSIIAFGSLWCVGAAVFWRCEHGAQGMTYFEALYFCYVSLLTIGYGDLAPKSSAGRPFFVFWSLIAVPTMTILVSDLGETVISKFKQGTFRLADFTVLPKHGVWREFYDRFPQVYNFLHRKKERHDAKKRLEEGFPAGPDPVDLVAPVPTIDELAADEPSDAELARRLPEAIRKVATDIRDDIRKRYSYEEWVDFTRLIRFSAKRQEDRETDNLEDGLIQWDWLGENSPMLSKGSEAEFVFERLVESLNRFIKHVAHLPAPSSHGVLMGLPSRRRDQSETDSLGQDGSGSAEDDDVRPQNEKATDVS